MCIYVVYIRFPKKSDGKGPTEEECVLKSKCLEHCCVSMDNAKTASIMKRRPSLKRTRWKNCGFSKLTSFFVEEYCGSQALRQILQFQKFVCLSLIDWSDADKMKLLVSPGDHFVDYVIANALLAVLSRQKTTFLTMLPELNLTAVNTFDIEAVDEIFLKYSSKWWREFSGFYFAIPSSKSMLKSLWFSDLKFRGCYSSYGLGGDEDSPERLNAPESNQSNKQVTFISGEATNPTNFSTTQHGALKSNWKQADCITSLYPDNLKAHHTTVIIVGAGLAGLAAAKTLLSRGIADFRILEAQDTPGGRVKTKLLDDGLIEIGAQWAHVSNSSMCDYAETRNLISNAKSIEGSGVYFCPGGQRVSPTLVTEIRNVVVNILNECFDLHDRENGNEPDNVGDFMDIEFNKYLNNCNDDPDVTCLKRLLYDWSKRFEVIDNSCSSLRDLSSRLWGQFGEPDTEQDHITVQGGFSSLVDSLVELVSPDALVTSCPVESIVWDSNPCQVRCSNGRVFTADVVLITSSIGYLQKNLTLFQPPLPEEHQHAIRSIGFGTINKIFLFYDEEWWRDLQGVQLVWDSQNRLDCLTEKMSWIRGLTGFDPVLTCKNVLLGWVGGPGALQCENLTDEEIADHCTIVLREFTGSPTLPQPQSVIRSRWNSNEYVCGAYCHLTPSSASCHPQDTLLQPVHRQQFGEKLEPALFFAGEALHKKYYSTANGAYDCGEQQALNILDYLSR